MKRGVAAALVALGAGACADTGVAPDDPVVGLRAPAVVEVDAVREQVVLTAELVHEGGWTREAEGATWEGCEGEVAELAPDGTLTTVAAGECEAVVLWESLQATVLVRVRPQGVLTLTFDDGWRSARDVALPILVEHGLVGNVAVVPQTAAWPAFLSVEQMQELHDAGWSFVSHTMTHDSLPPLPSDSMAWQIREPLRWLRERGLRTGDVLIVPYHAWGERERTVVEESVSAARGATVDAFWPEHMEEWRPADPYGLTSIDASALARTAEGRARALEYVREAVSEGRFLDLMFHDVRPEDEAGFRLLISEVAAYGDRVRTWSELYPLPDAAD